MENEANLLEKFVENKYEMEFEGQNLKKSESFIKWQNEMKKIYGNDAKLFKCKTDKIYYYAKKSDCKKVPLYKQKCPKCNCTNCYFCSKHIDDSYDRGDCCVYRRVYCLLFQERNKSDEQIFDKMFCFFIIPLFSFIYFVGTVSGLLFYKLKVANKKLDGSYIENYEVHLTPSSFTFLVIIMMNAGLAIMLSFSFFMLDIYFKIILILISLFWKYPLYYYLGLLNSMAL